MATHETGGGRAAQDVRDVAATAKEDVRNTTDRILDRGRDEARTILGQQQQRAAEGLTGVADALHAAAGRMEGGEIGFIARYAETAAGQVETWARRVQQRDIDDVLSEAENYARRNPEIFVGGAFLAGFLVARVAKASSDRRRTREWLNRKETGGIGRTAARPAGPSGDAARSAATGPATPARTSGSPAMEGSSGAGRNPHAGDAPEQRRSATPAGGPGPGSSTATETGGFAGKGERK